MKREFRTVLADPKLLKKAFEEDSEQWNWARTSPKSAHGMGVFWGAMWAYHWLKRNGYLVDKKGDE